METFTRMLLRVHRLAVGALPVALGFWYYHLLVPAEHARVYFIYDNVLIFLSDGIAAVAVAAWIGARLIAGQVSNLSHEEPVAKLSLIRTIANQPYVWALLGLVVLSSVSIAWSIDRTLSAYVAAHLWLMFGLFLSIRNEPECWSAIALGCVLGLVAQVFAGGYEFLVQSTAFLAPLRMMWPGSVVPTMSGPSVVQLADGTRWLRAYGTLPHPNIMAGFLLAFTAGPLAIFLHGGAKRWWAAGLFGVATMVLVLSFSRSAWLGYLAGGGVMVLHRKSLDRVRLLVLGAIALVSVIVVAIPLRELILTRTADGQVPTEARSTRERIWLGDQSLAIIGAHPLGGVGAGTFVVELAQESLSGPVEPVHNVALLTMGELGVLGGVLWLIACGAMLYDMRRARGVGAIVLSAAVVGLMVIGVFDHYLWALAPGRTVGAMILGAWAGQNRKI